MFSYQRKEAIMSKRSGGKTPMTTQAVARIYSATAKSGNGTIPKGGFEARAASAAAKNMTPATKSK